LRRAAAALTLAAVALTALAAGAFAAKPTPGFRYVGNINGGGYHLIVFDVARSGRRVQHMKTIGLPIFCDGESPSSTVRFKAVGIKGSSFTSTGKQVVAGKLIAKATVHGKFSSHTHAKGTVKVTYPGESKCGGTAHFTAIAGGLP
jgi:hypothetical protein